MQVKIKIKAKATWTARKRALLRDALDYANCHLQLYNFYEKVEIRLSGDAYAPGLCCDFGSRFLIKVSGNQPEHEILETLFHELTHVRQYLCGELEDVNPQVAYWKGTRYEGDFEDTASSEYWTAPWEVEARKVGKELRIDYYQI